MMAGTTDNHSAFAGAGLERSGQIPGMTLDRQTLNIYVTKMPQVTNSGQNWGT